MAGLMPELFARRVRLRDGTVVDTLFPPRGRAKPRRGRKKPPPGAAPPRKSLRGVLEALRGRLKAPTPRGPLV